MTSMVLLKAMKQTLWQGICYKKSSTSLIIFNNNRTTMSLEVKPIRRPTATPITMFLTLKESQCMKRVRVIVAIIIKTIDRKGRRSNQELMRRSAKATIKITIRIKIGVVIDVEKGKAIGTVTDMELGKVIGKTKGKTIGKMIGRAIGRAIGKTKGKAIGRAISKTKGRAISKVIGKVTGKMTEMVTRKALLLIVALNSSKIVVIIAKRASVAAVAEEVKMVVRKSTDRLQINNSSKEMVVGTNNSSARHQSKTMSLRSMTICHSCLLMTKQLEPRLLQSRTRQKSVTILKTTKKKQKSSSLSRWPKLRALVVQTLPPSKTKFQRRTMHRATRLKLLRVHAMS